MACREGGTERGREEGGREREDGERGRVTIYTYEWVMLRSRASGARPKARSYT